MMASEQQSQAALSLLDHAVTQNRSELLLESDERSKLRGIKPFTGRSGPAIHYCGIPAEFLPLPIAPNHLQSLCAHPVRFSASAHASNSWL